MAALGGREEGRKERTNSLPPPSERAAQKRRRSLTKEVEISKKEENFSKEREESLCSLKFCQ